MERLAIELSQEMFTDAAKISGTDAGAHEARKAAVREALSCGDRNNIGDMLRLAAIDLRVILEESKLDSDPWIVGARNAVIDLRTGTIRKYTKSDYITRTLDVDADEGAICPRWEQFINEIFPDPDVARFVWKAAGYSLTGLIREQCLFFLHGTGANGKSTFLETLEAVLGRYAERAGKGLIAANQRGDYPLREAAAINGARLLLASETDESDRFNESVIKDLTGGETMRGAHLYQNAFTFRPICKLWIAGNHKPCIRGTDNGIWRRVRLICFVRTFTPEERDPELATTLQAEASGILNWLKAGCMLWQQEGLTPPAVIEEAVADYRSEEDTLAGFIEECTREDRDSKTPHSQLFKAYEQWAKEMGIRNPLSSRSLSKRLRLRGWQQDPRTKSAKCIWRGIALGGGDRSDQVTEFPPKYSTETNIEKFRGKRSFESPGSPNDAVVTKAEADLHRACTASLPQCGESVNAGEPSVNSVGGGTGDHAAAQSHLTVPCRKQKLSLKEALIQTDAKGATVLLKPNRPAERDDPAAEGRHGAADECRGTMQRLFSHLSLRRFHCLRDLRRLGKPKLVDACVETLADHGRIQRGETDIVIVKPPANLSASSTIT